MLTVYPNDPTAVPPVLVRPDAGRLFFGRGRPGGLPPFPDCSAKLGWQSQAGGPPGPAAVSMRRSGTRWSRS